MARIALVTGGGTGIGRGIALALAHRGADLALVGRRAEPLRAVVQEATALGVRAIALPTDLASPTERAGLPDRLHAALGPVDVLVNSAGMIAGGELTTVASQMVHAAVTLNMLAPLALVQQLLPELRERHGAIIFVASATAHVPLPGAALYSGTKAGLRAFAQALRYEVEPAGVQVLVASPPGTATALTINMGQAAGIRRYPLADPLVVGERIVQALVAGKHDLVWGSGERALIMLERYAPWLAHRMIRWQRRRLIRMFAAAHE